MTWIVDTKGGPGKPYEITVVRNTNLHGQRSYGWYDKDKLVISASGPSGMWIVT